MRQAEIIAQVRAQFGFLFEEYGYQVIACSQFQNDGNWILVLQSATCGRFLVLQDRGEIIVALGPQGPDTSATDVPWFDLGVVVEYLSRGEQVLGSAPGDPDEQLAWSAGELRPYMDQVCGLFDGLNFALNREQMDRIGTRRERELWGNGDT